MATRTAHTAKPRQLLAQGTWSRGPQAFKVNFATDLDVAHADGDIVRACRIPKRFRVTHMEVSFDDLGTGILMNVGHAAVDGAPAAVATYWGTAVDVAAAAGRHRSIAHPFDTGDDEYYVILTISGAAVLTGVLWVIYDGEFLGGR